MENLEGDWRTFCALHSVRANQNQTLAKASRRYKEKKASSAVLRSCFNEEVLSSSHKTAAIEPSMLITGHCLQACTQILSSSQLNTAHSYRTFLLNGRWFGRSYSEGLGSAWFLPFKSQQSRCLSRLLQNHKIGMSHIELAECLFSRIHVRFILKIHSKTPMVRPQS